MTSPPLGIKSIASEGSPLLQRAQTAVKERGKTYGPPEQHFSRTVGAINNLFAKKLREPLTLADWAMFMIVDKVARELETPHDDNATDIAGYASCLDRVKKAKEPKDAQQ